MRPAIQDLLMLNPELDREAAERHLSQLDDLYFNRFSLPQISRHLEKISQLSESETVELVPGERGENAVECTIIAHDHPGIFSLITGLLASLGFHIVSGEIFTYREVKEAAPARRARTRRRRLATEPEKRIIIDHFSGKLSENLQIEVWFEELKKHLTEITGILESDEENAIQLARQKVNEMVTRYLDNLKESEYSALYPVQISIDNDHETGTRLTVVSQDTPAFLYAMSSSLALQGLSIEYVRIRTILGRIEDVIDVKDSSGEHITDPDAINKIKLTVLLTKQFTYFLDKASDPYRALSRFEQMVTDIVESPESARWVEMLSDPHAMDNLAKLLGASDFLWEDFIRMQYEVLLPILEPHVDKDRIAPRTDSLEERLDVELTVAETYEEKQEILNAFKNRESFQLDLGHILGSGMDFRSLAEGLTRLAEVIVNKSAEIIYDEMVRKHGKPCTVAGIETTYAIFGLGKLGGAALGYASDIELMLIYSDNGDTDGECPVSNTEFFSNLVQEITRFIETKKEGIFELDLRLRPHGKSGPLGVSLESFCRYYGLDGEALSYERLALVRLRAIGGDPELGQQVERLRDEYIYKLPAIKLEDIRKLRKEQFQEKNRPGEYNAKFSPGALVDLEYSVQLLQVMSRGEDLTLRTPRIHLALEALKDTGTLSFEELQQLNRAYDFLRMLINSLRMLRGSAQDLFLPPVASDEFQHLARRMGYDRKGELSAAQQLFVEFETRTAIVRSFVERHLGRDSLPAPTVGNVVDILINDKLPEKVAKKILEGEGFSDTKRAVTNLKSMAGNGRQRELFIQLAVLAVDILSGEPAPDMALNNWERFIKSLAEPQVHYSLLLSQPKRLQILLGIFSRSQFLADTLIENPEFFEWVTSRETLYGKRGFDVLRKELRDLAVESPERSDWLSAMVRFRKRETLRIGACDMCLHFPFRDITSGLANLAKAIIQVTLEEVWRRMAGEGALKEDIARYDKAFCIMAFGKLGGDELNYSSDIDLLGLYDNQLSDDARVFQAVMERVRADLSEHTDEGYGYRVDLRLRPYGRSGPISPSLASLVKYFQEAAAHWEIQAGLKLSPVAGNFELGNKAMDAIRGLLKRKRPPGEIVASIREMRRAAISQIEDSGEDSDANLKTGRGGIRDIEFLVQGLQLINGHKFPGILTGNTLTAIELLREKRILSKNTAKELAEDYIFLRTIEHYLQILEDQQLHSLPENPKELNTLIKRVSKDANPDLFKDKLENCLKRVAEAFNDLLK